MGDLLGLPELTVAIALAAGIVCQSMARHMGIPGIVVLLAAGVLLGPDALNVVRPQSLGVALNEIVGFAVAVILFEGGMQLSLKRFWRARGPIRGLLTVGAVATVIGASACARWILEWPLTLCALFGTLVVVTGPTVINPLMRRLKIQKKVATILEAEGILLDAPGAILAAVTLDMIRRLETSPEEATFLQGAWLVLEHLGLGSILGAVMGGILAVVLRSRSFVPEGLENVFTLAMAWILFQGADAVMPESGIAAVTVAGIVLGNVKTPLKKEIAEFKEQLTVLLIGMLFVLLAADVRLEDIASLGWGGLGVATLLALVLRPMVAFLSTMGSDLTWQQRMLIGWIGPRGIVAAAVASLFAAQLQQMGMDGGVALRALVFLVIALTVTLAGLTGGLMAGVLGLRRPSNNGWLILGAGIFARQFAAALGTESAPAVLIDSNAKNVTDAESEGLKVIYGNGIEETVLRRAEVDTRTGVIAMTSNEDTNLLFLGRVRHEARLPEMYACLRSYRRGVTPAMIEGLGGKVVCDEGVDVDAWGGRLESGLAEVRRWSVVEGGERTREHISDLSEGGAFLPWVWRHNDIGHPYHGAVLLESGDELIGVVSVDTLPAVEPTLLEPIASQGAAEHTSADELE